MKTFKYIMFVVFTIGIISCSAEDGMDGAPGEQGVPGQDGNANVVSVFLENQSVSIGATTFMIPQLTQEIYDNGFVYGYVTLPGNDTWEPFPLSDPVGTIIAEIDAIGVGQIIIRTTFGQNNLNFRFVLVEGNDLNGLVDFTNYGSVVQFYNLD